MNKAGQWLIVGVLIMHMSLGAAESQDAYEPRYKILPYFVTSEFLGFGLGLAIAGTHVLQPNTTALMMGMYTNNSSGTLYSTFRNLYVSGLPRLLFSAELLAGHDAEGRFFVEGNTDYAGQRAGSTGSDYDNHIMAASDPYFFLLETKAILPIGEGKGGYGQAVKRRVSGQGFNPFEHGATYLSITFLMKIIRCILMIFRVNRIPCPRVVLCS